MTAELSLVIAVPTANPRRLTATANQPILAPDERSLQVELVRLDRTVPVAGRVGGRVFGTHNTQVCLPSVDCRQLPGNRKTFIGSLSKCLSLRSLPTIASIYGAVAQSCSNCRSFRTSPARPQRVAISSRRV